jgi:hypothetical protein
MKDQILKIAKVKSEKEFYKKYPSEEAFMKAHGKAFKKAAMGSKMVNDQLHQLTDFGNPPIAQYGSSVNPNTGMFQMPMSGKSVSQYDTMAAGYGSIPPPEGFGNVKAAGGGAAGAAMAGLNALPAVIGGIEAMGSQKKAIKKADQSAQLSGLANQAAFTREKVNRKYVRPEDSLVQPGQLGNPYGSGTNYLAAQNGTMIGGNPTEIQNTYNPGDIYTDGGYEPIESKNIKQYKKGGKMPKAELGEYFQDSGQAQIGGAVGEAAGNALFGPIGGMAGKLLGQVGGNLLGGAKDARELKKYQDQSALNSQQAAWQNQLQSGEFSKYMEKGGKVGDEYKWVSHTWQPQVIAKFGEYNVKDLLKPPHDADMLRSGGHFAQVGYTAPSAAALYTGRPDMPRMEGGGRMTSTNMMFDTDKYPRANHGKASDMDGDLQVLDGGKAETISYNPFLPDGGETVMFKGRSHDDGGIPINFGENGVEVEGGEPAVKLQDGGRDSSMVVFGNMKLSQMAADEFGIADAKGKKFKHVATDISNVEKKQNKLIEKATERADMTTGNSGFDQLKMNTSQAQLMGANMKLRSAAILKQNLAAVQNAILDTASELGVKSDELAQGKLVKEKDPRMIAQKGTNVPYSGTPFLDAPDLYPGPTGRDIINNVVSSALSGVPTRDEYTQIPYQPGYSSMNTTLPTVTVTGDKLSTSNNLLPDGASGAAEAADKGKGFDWKGLGQMALSNIAPFLRPRTKLPLDPEELYPEYYAMATNQLDPVQAQTFQPMLDTPYDISFNDQINAIDSQSRAAIRAAGSNPAAQAQIMSQSLEAKNRVLAEQNRVNQANKMGTYNKNRALLNDAQLKNLQILDQQYVRQSQAKSNTRTQALEALKSIAAKTAQNKLENQTLNTYENMYNYRFSPSGVAYNTNAPAQFNIPEGVGIEGLSNLDKAKVKDLYERIISRDKTGNVTGSKEKTSTSKTSRNGSIVQALKNL